MIMLYLVFENNYPSYPLKKYLDKKPLFDENFRHESTFCILLSFKTKLLNSFLFNSETI